MIRFAAAAVMMAAGGCADRPPTRVDGSTPEAFERTTAQARRDLPDADRLIFDKAIRTIGGRRFAERDPDALARVTFNGMTAAEIVADQKMRDQ
ncbi:MAG TPA: hypothetical protein VFZ35_02070 [Sphingomicrobium sp.]